MKVDLGARLLQALGLDRGLAPPAPRVGHGSPIANHAPADA